MRADMFLKELREELRPLNESILEHPYVGDAKEGRLSRPRLSAFFKQQHYIITYDLRALSLCFLGVGRLMKGFSQPS